LDFDAQSFDFDKDLDKVDSILAPILNANNPDLEPLRSRGGKLIMYTGLADPLVPYQDALHYYERVIEAQGSLEKTQSFFRFFLVPGVEHCGGGQGPCYFGQWISDITESSESNLFTSLVQWVEKGIAPEQIIATAYNEGWSIHFQRPIYPYPKFPHYIEGEDPALPSGYRGVDHERGLVVIPAARYLK
jgi:feruloyl esterase